MCVVYNPNKSITSSGNWTKSVPVKVKLHITDVPYRYRLIRNSSVSVIYQRSGKITSDFLRSLANACRKYTPCMCAIWFWKNKYIKRTQSKQKLSVLSHGKWIITSRREEMSKKNGDSLIILNKPEWFRWRIYPVDVQSHNSAETVYCSISHSAVQSLLTRKRIKWTYLKMF